MRRSGLCAWQVYFFAAVSVIAAVAGGVVLADDSAVPSGIFKTQGPSHYLNGEIELQTWGNSLLMHATLIDFGRAYQVEATLEPEGQGQYRGAGKIFVRYTPNTGCVHRFGVRIFVNGGRIYLRENTPAHLPWNPNGPCEAAGPYQWYNHPAPYDPLQ